MANQIKTFYFKRAEYFVGDANGSEILLKIDYKNKKYELENKGKKNGILVREAKKIGKSLIKRKHGMNFVDRVIGKG
ncbi:MAG: hypothetical protein ACD_52C00175G0002 [uncultured bacterium]|uniref:Uncharacterized protein n=1 Tax=Candidatus Woesebacteria bacterium RIFCSPHIGHO2_12_FULL_41_24 TaxID=1802510 RepID=A0A1F8AT08_9BACT|nr:MAG: hypothetical protein ACD_52C00175G0002 [uncultured bacterium]OGM15066.1 MAG: hypothetical protein A2W15_04545 [Candidatus Woesebacteria bacterium RBG_16_41_13]OGM28982.1 MAG: hypothetical protein A2873_01520 [Candidatus Woesebacteria bacterium RIFCSPHIGHO2_01_FULL_42_80]OGM35146.1 MAG: hypothetical protein A3D84_02265 [Candidatus Woesebacteria bacterium RIFCSPHIGHO2_02_FULL_42_20]OGM54882.1 MAG: hypothetical protein A3E44_01865 [Candidatus Woesebacteria bacterium RIFCSPHIGHO2_12_FULL_41